jgi:hypothetical protein
VVALAFLDNVAPVLSKVDISDAVVSSGTSDVVVVVTFDVNVTSVLSDATLATNITTTTTSDVPDETTASDISTIDGTDATLTTRQCYPKLTYLWLLFHQEHLMWWL